MQLNLDHYDVREFLEEVYQFLKIDFEYAGIQFTVESDYEGMIYFDKERMRRVIVNLSNNAREAMENYKNNYEFKVYLRKENSHFIFSILDNGPGLPDAIEGKIFEAFATEGKANGTGLGLFMSKWIVERHGGKLTYTSEKNKGTIFYISIPEQIQNEDNSL